MFAELLEPLYSKAVDTPGGSVGAGAAGAGTAGAGAGAAVKAARRRTARTVPVFLFDLVREDPLLLDGKGEREKNTQVGSINYFELMEP